MLWTSLWLEYPFKVKLKQNSVPCLLSLIKFVQWTRSATNIKHTATFYEWGMIGRGGMTDGWHGGRDNAESRMTGTGGYQRKKHSKEKKQDVERHAWCVCCTWRKWGSLPPTPSCGSVGSRPGSSSASPSVWLQPTKDSNRYRGVDPLKVLQDIGV